MAGVSRGPPLHRVSAQLLMHQVLRQARDGWLESLAGLLFLEARDVRAAEYEPRQAHDGRLESLAGLTCSSSSRDVADASGGALEQPFTPLGSRAPFSLARTLGSWGASTHGAASPAGEAQCCAVSIDRRSRGRRRRACRGAVRSGPVCTCFGCGISPRRVAVWHRPFPDMGPGLGLPLASPCAPTPEDGSSRRPCADPHPLRGSWHASCYMASRRRVMIRPARCISKLGAPYTRGASRAADTTNDRSARSSPSASARRPIATPGVVAERVKRSPGRPGAVEPVRPPGSRWAREGLAGVPRGPLFFAREASTPSRSWRSPGRRRLASIRKVRSRGLTGDKVPSIRRAATGQPPNPGRALRQRVGAHEHGTAHEDPERHPWCWHPSSELRLFASEERRPHLGGPREVRQAPAPVEPQLARLSYLRGPALRSRRRSHRRRTPLPHGRLRAPPTRLFWPGPSRHRSSPAR